MKAGGELEFRLSPDARQRHLHARGLLGGPLLVGGIARLRRRDRHGMAGEGAHTPGEVRRRPRGHGRSSLNMPTTWATHASNASPGKRSEQLSHT